jgi:hypothetical protein
LHRRKGELAVLQRGRERESENRRRRRKERREVSLSASNYLQVLNRDASVEVRDVHLGAVGDALADDGGVKGGDGGGLVLLGTSGVGLLIAGLTTSASRAGGTARGTATGAGTTGSTLASGALAGLGGLLSLDDVSEGHVESGSHCDGRGVFGGEGFVGSY